MPLVCLIPLVQLEFNPDEGASNIGEPTLVWYPNNANPYQSQPYFWPRPAADTVFAINVQNVVVSGSARSFSYTVTV